jgi:hypothetical protein
MQNSKDAKNAQLTLNDAQPTKSDAGKQSADLDAPGVATALAKRIKEDIDEYCVRTYDGGHRSHLGASLIGRECKRYLWYVFRWCLHEKTTGRQQRLFNRGHREEDRFIEWLEGIGFQLWFENYEGFAYHAESDSYCILKENEEGDGLAERILPDNPNFRAHIRRAKADGLEFPQYRISDVMGHFGGSLDGIARLPERYGIDEPVLVEFKTNGTGAGFNKLGDSGMPVAKPEHFAQTSTYGKKYGFRYVLYLNINKNDDSLHVEVTKLDNKLGEQMIIKAEQIILSQDAPPRLSDNPTFHKCGYCAMKEICHKGAIPEKNCRSCKNARPVENAEWFCDVHNGVIPKDFIPQACPSYIPITTVAKNV